MVLFLNKIFVSVLGMVLVLFVLFIGEVMVFCYELFEFYCICGFGIFDDEFSFNMCWFEMEDY